jgi:hypothetical protein
MNEDDEEEGYYDDGNDFPPFKHPVREFITFTIVILAFVVPFWWLVWKLFWWLVDVLGGIL